MAASGSTRTFSLSSPHANSQSLADFPHGRFERPLPRQKRSVSGGYVKAGSGIWQWDQIPELCSHADTVATANRPKLSRRTRCFGAECGGSHPRPPDTRETSSSR